MALVSGMRLGPYQVVSQIGAGGMGEVYKATDTRLRRTVAIKILPAHLSDDPERLARFRREAQAISSLNHPHICTLHDVGVEDKTHFLVMEYVEGETLDQRIGRGPMQMDDALEYAKQIADALKAAHGQGIVHRDLKPGNVMISSSGVKLLDFGLAKFSSETLTSGTLSQVPTASQTLTEEGTIMGTFRYMSPEQLEGKEVDGRTDLYALCLILYEMVSGKSPFEGASRASLIASILKDQPRPLADLRSAVPHQLDRIVQTGLEKAPDKRWQSARELKHAFDWIRQDSGPATAPTAARSAWLWKGAAAALALALAVLVLRQPSPDPERRLEIWTPETADPTGFAVSPDGQLMVYVASGPNGSQLWLRPLDADSAEPLPQTLGASHPFWSPDSKAIGFFAERLLKRIDLVGRVTTPLAAAVSPYGGNWGAEDILYSPSLLAALMRIPAGGGDPSPALTQPPAGGLFPVFVGDGTQFLFRKMGLDEIQIGRLDSKGSIPLPQKADYAEMHPSGYVLFVRDGALLAQRVDLAAGQMLGNEVAVAGGVLTSNFGGGTALSVSASGIVAYRRGKFSRQLVWLDRSGQPLGKAGGDVSELRWPAISGKGRVALQKTGDAQLWIIDQDNSAPAQFTFAKNVGQASPIFSPDDLWIAYYTLADGSIRRKRSNGAGSEEILLPKSGGPPSDWYGDTILVSDGTNGNGDVSVLTVGSGQERRPYLNGPYTETRGVFSPDGRWVAYESNETGHFEIYVRPFPDAQAGQRQISSDGGFFARWSTAGDELYYLTPAGVLMAASVIIEGDVFSSKPPRELFRTRIPATEMADLAHPYDVSRDGRFLMRVPAEAVNPITILLNWSPDRN